MSIIINGLVIDRCGTGIVAPSNIDMQMSRVQITRTNTAMLFTDDIHRDDLKDLLSRIEALELNNKNDKELQAQATGLIQAQLSSPSPNAQFLTTLNNIATGTIGSALGASIATFIAPYIS